MPPKTKLRGIIPPLVTPLTAAGDLDRPGLTRLISHVLSGHVQALFILGTTGEGPSLSVAQRREVILRVCQDTAGRVPVWVSISDPSLAESVALSRYAADCGAAALVVAPPYYYPPSQSELSDYFTRLSAAIPLPFYLYNLPALTKVSLGEDVVRRSLALPNCHGLKDSSGDLQYFKRMHRLIRASGVHSLYMGPEELLAESLLAGGDGGISGGANVWPSLYTAIFQAAEKQDWSAAQAAQSRVTELSRRIYALAGYGATVTKVLKACLTLRDICGPAMAPPSQAWDPTLLPALRQELTALGLDSR